MSGEAPSGGFDHQGGQGDAAPLIVTAGFDAEAGERLQRLRDTHFPAHLNRVPAHLTLFHHLPGLERRSIEAALTEAVAAVTPIPFRTTPRSLGRGVALAVAADGIASLRGRLAKAWDGWLTPQDRQGFRPHVTIQNKVEPARARALLEQFEIAPPLVSGTITHLDLWYYRGGPWEAIRRFPLGAGD